MSFINPNGVAKRILGLLLFESEDAGVADSATLRSEFVDIQYLAAYQLAYPGSNALTNTLNPAATGASITLTNGNLTAVGSVGSSNSNSVALMTDPNQYVFEWVLNGAPSTIQLGLHSDFGPFDNDGNLSNYAGSAWVDAFTGDVFGFSGFAGNIGALSAGDVLGFVFEMFNSTVHVFLNGVEVQAFVHLNSDSTASVGVGV